MHAFWEKGYESTSLQELVERMGIGRASLYDTFGSKRELFAEALDRYAAELESTIGAELGRRDQASSSDTGSFVFSPSQRSSEPCSRRIGLRRDSSDDIG